MIRILLALFLYLGLVVPSSAVTIKIATISPDGTSWMQRMRASADEIARLTEGRVKLRFYPGGVMGNDKSVLRKIRVGQLHGGFLAAGGLENVYSDMRLYSLPLIFRSFQEVDFVRERMDSVLMEGLRRKGYISYGFIEGGFAYLMSSNPLTTVEDLKQQKVWVPEGDEVTRMTLEALGVSPIALPITDVLTGLQTGLINTISSSPIGTIALQWHTQVQYLTDLPLLYLSGTLVIREKALAKISSGDRRILTRVMLEASAEINRQNRQDNIEAMEALMNQGIIIVKPSDKGEQVWRENVKHTLEQMSNDNYFTATLYQALLQHLETYAQVQGTDGAATGE